MSLRNVTVYTSCQKQLWQVDGLTHCRQGRDSISGVSGTQMDKKRADKAARFFLLRRGGQTL
jgi:hypothetical protein